jgi:DNA-binding transcriptional ArsR family regulator
MLADADISPVALLLSDPTRVAILMALSDGREVAASELAEVADVSASTASIHLAKLTEARLVGVRRDGRHRFYRLARPELMAAMEALAVLSPQASPRTHRQARIGRAVRSARTCYDHLAGKLGVAVTGALVDRGILRLGERQFEVTQEGSAALSDFGVDLEAARQLRRAFAPFCLDWSERVPHLAGSLGAAMLAIFLERDWIERTAASRAVQITTAGRRGLQRTFGVSL